VSKIEGQKGSTTNAHKLPMVSIQVGLVNNEKSVSLGLRYTNGKRGLYFKGFIFSCSTTGHA